MYYLVFGVFVLDRFLKLLVSVNIEAGHSIPIMPFMNITNLTNTGIAFSLLTGSNTALIWINTAIVILLASILLLGKREPVTVFVAYAVILGGALSNLWDRIFYSGVIDYLDFKIWPVFNIADSAISIGAALLFISAVADFIKISRKQRKKSA